MLGKMLAVLDPARLHRRAAPTDPAAGTDRAVGDRTPYIAAYVSLTLAAVDRLHAERMKHA